MVLGSELVPGLQLLQTNPNVQSAMKLVNNMYNMFQQQNSHAVEESLLSLKESMHNTNLRENTVEGIRS